MKYLALAALLGLVQVQAIRFADQPAENENVKLADIGEIDDDSDVVI